MTVVEPDTDPTLAVMVEVPGAKPDSSPEAVIVAAAVFEEFQEVTGLVSERVLPSEKVPVTVSCSVVCFAMVELSGFTLMETRFARVTVRFV